MFMLTWRIALQSQRLCLKQGVATILYQYLVTKQSSDDREFLQQIIERRNRYEKHQVFFTCQLCL